MALRRILPLGVFSTVPRTGDHDHVRWHADGGGHALLHGRAERIPARAIALPCFRDDDEALGAERGIVDAERGDASLANAGAPRRRLPRPPARRCCGLPE